MPSVRMTASPTNFVVSLTTISLRLLPHLIMGGIHHDPPELNGDFIMLTAGIIDAAFL